MIRCFFGLFLNVFEDLWTLNRMLQMGGWYALSIALWLWWFCCVLAIHIWRIVKEEYG